jgi:hypothetical protein
MRSYQEITRAISVRWIIRKTLRAVIYCVNPLNFFKVLLRLIKWFLYFVFGAVAIGMLTLAVGNYATAAEWVPAYKGPPTQTSTAASCYFGSSLYLVGSNMTAAQCLAAVNVGYGGLVSLGAVSVSTTPSGVVTHTYPALYNGASWGGNRFVLEFTGYKPQFSCPPPDNPKFTIGPKVTDKGTVCERLPVQCLIGSIKDTNTITGKEFCRPICQGIAGNTYGEPLTPVKYFQSNFGSVQIQCYGQCSIRPVGGSVSVDPNLKIWAAVIQFTGENCPIQTQGTEEETSTAGANTPVTPPNSSASTDAAQNQLQ